MKAKYMEPTQVPFDFMRVKGPNRIYFALETPDGTSTADYWSGGVLEKEGVLMAKRATIVPL